MNIIRCLAMTVGVIGLVAMLEQAAAKDTGRIFVSNEQSHTVTVLDGRSYALVATIRTGRRPRDIKFNAARTRLYVACGDDNRIDVIDVDKLAVIDSIRGVDDPEEIGRASCRERV